MRAFGCSAVFLTFALGVGGVATRPLAEPAHPAAAAHAEKAKPEAPAPTPLARAVDAAVTASIKPQTCKASRASGRAVAIDLSKVEVPAGFVSLNRRGYNYRMPGDPPQAIPDSTGRSKPNAP